MHQTSKKNYNSTTHYQMRSTKTAVTSTACSTWCQYPSLLTVWNRNCIESLVHAVGQQLIPVATFCRHGSGADCRLESCQGHRCLFFCVCVVCCKVEISAMGWSLFQRNPTECSVWNWVWLWSQISEDALDLQRLWSHERTRKVGQQLEIYIFYNTWWRDIGVATQTFRFTLAHL